MVALAAIYRYGPSGAEPRWAMAFGRSAAAAIGWLITSVPFSWYIAHFGAYDATYGLPGAAVGMMMWMWIWAIVILLGANSTPRSSTKP
jgi:membrane protein